MNVDNLKSIYLIVSALIPGFIYNSILLKFIPLRRKEKELFILQFLSATGFIYALCSPFIYFLLFSATIIHHPNWRAALWFAVIFFVPVLVGVIHADIVQKDRLAWFYRWLNIRPISPIPTGWDWIFSKTEPCFVLVTLINGIEIAGFFGLDSMASSDPDRRDIYIERVYEIPANDGAWTPVERSLGIYISESQIAFIELKDQNDV